MSRPPIIRGCTLLVTLSRYLYDDGRPTLLTDMPDHAAKSPRLAYTGLLAAARKTGNIADYQWASRHVSQNIMVSGSVHKT